MTYDEKCYELALHFLQDVPGGEVKVGLASDLAKEIQRAVEDFLAPKDAAAFDREIADAEEAHLRSLPAPDEERAS